jgi:hypothetical protein
VIDRKQIDVLHLHGYGATTFGRMAGPPRRLPTILHEHANLTDTPWFQKAADTALELPTDIAIAVSQSTADFVIRARKIPPRKVKVVFPACRSRDFSRARSAEEVQAARGTGHRAERRGDRHGDPAARLEGQPRRCRSSRVERAAGCASS